MKKVLAIDGGGVRGIVPAMVLAEIERQMAKPAHQIFDVIAGTSTGAFIGALATRRSDTLTPLPADEIIKLFQKDARKYFKKRFAWNLFSPKYQSRSVEKVLRQYLGDADLARAATRLIVPVYALRKRPPRVHYFSSLAAGQIDADNHLMWQVVRGATAAPTYFEPFKVEAINGKSEISVIDGGVFANNPAMLGWLHAHQSLNTAYVSLRRNNDSDYRSLDEQFDTRPDELRETVVVSLGTGFYNQAIDPKKARRWGILRWMKPALKAMYEGQAAQVTAELNIASDVKLVSYFRRLQPELDARIDLGDVSKLAELQEVATRYIQSPDGKKAINDVCSRL